MIKKLADSFILRQSLNLKYLLILLGCWLFGGVVLLMLMDSIKRGEITIPGLFLGSLFGYLLIFQLFKWVMKKESNGKLFLRISAVSTPFIVLFTHFRIPFLDVMALGVGVPVLILAPIYFILKTLFWPDYITVNSQEIKIRKFVYKDWMISIPRNLIEKIEIKVVKAKFLFTPVLVLEIKPEFFVPEVLFKFDKSGYSYGTVQLYNKVVELDSSAYDNTMPPRGILLFYGSFSNDTVGKEVKDFEESVRGLGKASVLDKNI